MKKMLVIAGLILVALLIAVVSLLPKRNGGSETITPAVPEVVTSQPATQPTSQPATQPTAFERLLKRRKTYPLLLPGGGPVRDEHGLPVYERHVDDDQ